MCLCRCHVIQRNLRAPGEKGYKIPSGFLFDYITCANYTAEIFGWVLFGIATQTVAVMVFISAGGYQMGLWAAAKHARLQKVSYPSSGFLLPLYYFGHYLGSYGHVT